MSTFIQKSNKIREIIPSHVQIIVAAKTQSAATIQKVYDAGFRQFGHNYLQEAISMKSALPSDITWRMIGHLQHNKINKAIQTMNTIDTLDSIRSAKTLNTRCETADIIMPVMIEINTALEENKAGVHPDNVLNFADQLILFKNLQLTGLFTMGKAFVPATQQRPYFNLANQLFEALKQKEAANFSIQNLSMGMSASFEIAIEEGATMVRLGTALFGRRN